MADKQDNGPGDGERGDGELGGGVVAPKERHVMRWLVVGTILLVGLVIAWLIGSAVIPRWWAQRVSSVIDGSLVRGSALGGLIGAVCTFVPLVILRLGVRFRRGWRSLVAFVVLAAITAAPNLFTLGIVAGSGNAAHAGERILDVDGPGFRGGTAVGALIALGVAGWLGWLLRSRRKNRERAVELARELSATT